MTDHRDTDPARPPIDEDTMNRLEQLLTRPEPPPGAVSVHQLRRLVAGDLSSEESEQVRASADPTRLAALEAEDAAFHAARPYSQVKDALFARAGALEPVESRRPGFFAGLLSRRALGWSLGAALTAVVLGLLVPDPDRPRTPADVTDPATNRLKGASPLEAWLDVEGTPQRVEPGVGLAAGDRLQFKITTTRNHLALLGVDGTGTVSRYVPVGGELSAPFVPGNARPLSDALVLDDAPGPEVFVAVLTDEPMLVEDLERALHDLVDVGGPGAVRGIDAADLGVTGEVAVFFAEKVPR